jgi:hypothetical protein
MEKCQEVQRSRIWSETMLHKICEEIDGFRVLALDTIQNLDQVERNRVSIQN